MKQKQQKRKQQQKKNPPPFHLPRLTHATWTSPIDSTTTNNNNINNNHNTKKSSASRFEIGIISFAGVLDVGFLLLAVYRNQPTIRDTTSSPCTGSSETWADFQNRAKFSVTARIALGVRFVIS
ncbi:predicted protein [Chaetomium globosum CBS 148.51]|uniref:Uncharacterized protein n=1 Tax=Chaetomium globosum (strain ATCC 6205 / CBS 148.51 / DSM 1962 / NBRC 6347 / NRRL 1970) TaxID=306901 RepID=Q2H8Y1_CHAGB|nr:uncharacterized protein CHGG_03323 [Chaetomium globosum CBS 148.51]EAQ91388.1 predicted protein [Chaetomium globosum CBS 148.51]